MEKPVCQSCGMPMEPIQYATNQDGSPNDTYCNYCFADGAFTNKNTFDQMVETCVPFLATPESGMTADQARTHLRTTMKNLKRWQ